MIDKITEGFNLVFRWMGIWLACNLVTGALFRLDDWAKRRKARKAMGLLPEGRRRVTAVVRETETQVIVQGMDAPEADTEPDADSKRKTGEETEAGEESDEEKSAPVRDEAVET